MNARAAVAAGLACALLCSCAKAGLSRSPSRGNTWTVPGVLRVAVTEEPNTLVRMFSNQSSADDVTALLFEPFFRYDDRERPVPALATQFPTLRNGLISRDGLRVTFPLRPRALWSDGAPVTAQDVIFTWHAIVDGRNPVVYTAGYDKIKTMVAEGPHRVTLVLREPFSPAVYLFSEGSFPPLPAHLLQAYQTINNIPYDSAPVGDGPFVLRRWAHGSELVFDANPRYWRGPPHLREIDMKVIPDPTTQLNELRTHEIDLLDGVGKPLVAELGTISGIWIQKQLQANYRHLDFDLRNPILRDANVRRAIASAIDVQRIIHDVYGGLAVRAATDIPPFSWAANRLAPLAYDPRAAARRLEASGWRLGSDGIRTKNGRPLALSISSTTDNRSNAAAETLIAQDLHAVGFDVSIKNYAGTMLFAENGPLYSGKYDMSWIVNTEGVDPDDLPTWGCNWMPPRGSNTNFYCNARVDRFLADAERSYDTARRRSDYQRAWQIMLDQVPADIIYWDVALVAGNSDLRNVKPSPVITDYWNAWEWEL